MKNVQVRGGYVLHIGTVEGTFRVGDTVKCLVDEVCILQLNFTEVLEEYLQISEIQPVCEISLCKQHHFH